MGKSTMAIWGVILVVSLLSRGILCLNCSSVDSQQCLCFKSDSVDLQCPPQNPLFTLSISNKDQITLQCQENSTSFMDLIPALDIPNSKSFRMEFCYFNSSFINILNKFDVQNLNSLSFETQSNKNDPNLTFSKDSFKSLQSLESLTISYSTIFLENDFLINTPNLKVIRINQNSISKFGKYFKYVPKLKQLELDGNQITELPDGVFENLSTLTRLHLFNNNITTISKNTFLGLINLTLLELSSNHIQELPEDTFSSLRNLVQISLRANRIKQIYRTTFAHNTLLENLRLGYNRDIILSDYVFENLTRLRTVELFYNNFQTIPEHVFKNCQKLEEITLRANRLTSLPENIFYDLRELKILDLSENNLNLLPLKLFSTLENLEILNLNNNQLSVITNDLFHNTKLKRLDLHKNMIAYIQGGAFTSLQGALTYLDLSYNKWNNSYDIPAFQEYSPLNYLLKAEELILSHNKIAEIPGLPSLLGLRRMDLSYNEIKRLPVWDYAHSIRYTYEVDLSNNKIEKVDFTLVDHVLTINKNNSNDEFYGASDYDRSTGYYILKLKENPIICDCSNYDLIRYNNDEMKEFKTLVDIDQDGLSCANEKHIQVADLRPTDIDCPVIHGCPSSCQCSYKPYNTAVIVNCSFANLTGYPTFNFSTRSYNQTFLDLRGNNLKMGPSGVREPNYENITNLDLSGNLITKMEWIPPHIKVLNLDNNLIKNLDAHFIDKLKNATQLERLYAKGNPWECSCSSLDLQKYLMQYYHKVNSSDVYCQNFKVQLVKLTDLCKVSPYLSTMLPIVLAVLLFFALAIALYYRYQTELKIYLFAKNMCLWFVTEEELDKDKTYDVFISYAHQDEKFVMENLLNELEHGDNQYKVCIHVRDWIPGEFIAEQVVNSVKDSRRTLVVLSNNFLNSIWGKLEFRTAHTEAITEGRARVIVLLYGDIDESKLDDELKSYLKTNTYIQWGDKYFWNKLKYALPHSKRNKFYDRNKKLMLKIDDKFDLIKNPPSPSNTSTPPIQTLDASLLKNKELKIGIPKNIEGENPLLIKQV